jgi:hypothetical protein
LPHHNRRFAKPPPFEGNAFVSADPALLAETLCIEEERVVARDNTVAYGGRRLQVTDTFQTPGLTIKAPLPFARSDTYSIDWQGNEFTASVDGATNIVYGAAGQQFITISLCNLTSR